MRAKNATKAIAAAVALAFAPALMAQGIPTTEEIIWPESGAFAGYPAQDPGGRIWRFSVYGALHHDDNIFRLPGNANVAAVTGRNDRSDTVRRLGIGLRADIPISRQRITLEADVDDNDFSTYDHLDYVGHRLSGIWSWRVGSAWAGDIGAGTRKTLGGYGDVQAGDRNLVTENRAFASVAHQLTARWRIRGGVDAVDVDHSGAARQALEQTSQSVTLGVDYVTPATNSLGVQVRYTNGESPDTVVGATIVKNDYDQVETSLVGRWAPTGKTMIDARAGYTKRSHDQLTGRDFSGFTGRLSGTWSATAKTMLNIALWRDIQAYQTVLSGPLSPAQLPSPTLPAPGGVPGGPGTIGSPGSSIIDPALTPTDIVAEPVQGYVVARGISLGPAWAPTEKIVLQARLLHEKLDFRGDPAAVLGVRPRGDDTFKGFNFAVGYTPIRALLLGLAYQTGKRTSTVAGRDFEFDAVTLNARFSF